MASVFFSDELSWVVTWRVRREVARVGRYTWRVNGLVAFSGGRQGVLLVCDRSGSLACVVDAQPAEISRASRRVGWRWWDDTRVRLITLESRQEHE